MRNVQKAFTLVELIIVVTIVALLGTIAFFSLGWYSRDARNVKKSVELNAISKQIRFKSIEWINLLLFASNSGSIITGTNIKISWRGDYSLFSDRYTAWDINAVVLGGDPEMFSDKVFDTPYKIGVTTLCGGAYELAATLEGQENILDTLVIGNWNPRKSSVVRWTRDHIQDNIFYLSWAVYQSLWFKKWDVVWIAAGTYTITKLVNSNEIHLDTTITTPGANIFLNVDETRHLIKKWDSNFPIDIGKWTLYVPYK